MGKHSWPIGLQGKGLQLGRRFLAQRAAPKPQVRSPLLDFQLDLREVKHMAPHVLASAMAAAGAGNHNSQSLWRAYSDRALELRKQLTLRDVRRMLQGYAAVGIKDSALFRDMLKASWEGDENASAKDLCSVTISLAKLRCGAESLEDFAQHFEKHSLEELETIDLSSLANAFSRISCRNKVFLQRLSDRLCADASSMLLPPVATTMALNAFAVLKHCDRELFTVLVNNAIRPCVSDFTITQAALAVDALARCSEVTEDMACEIFRSFVQRWLSHGMLEQLAEPEDLAHLSNSAVKLNILEDKELNYVFAACGLRYVGMFSTPQLAMFCSNLARLPSTGREAFLSVVALRILPQAVRSLSFVDLGLILQAMSNCDVSLTQEVVVLVQTRLAEVAKEQVAHLAQHKQTEVANSVAAALERVAESSLKILSTADGKQLLASIRPLSLELFACNALRFRTAAALLLMHGHFRIRDVELFDAMGVAVESAEISPVLAGRLLRGMAPLGHAVKPVMLAIDQSFGSPRGTWQRSLPALTADLFAAALLDFAHLSEDTVNALLLAVKDHCTTELSLSTSLRLKCAGEISASSHAWLRKAKSTGDATWLADWAEEVFSASNGPQHDLVPSVEGGLLRSVFASLQSYAKANKGEALAAWPVQGFRSDLACRLPSQMLVLEVNSQQRFYAGSHELLASCRLRQAAVKASGAKVCQVNFWEWPADDPDRWLKDRLDLCQKTTARRCV